jgi:hypothetical protein
VPTGHNRLNPAFAARSARFPCHGSGNELSI